MKKMFFSLLLMLPFILNAQLVKTLKKTIELKMPGKVYQTKGNGLDRPAGEDSLPGTRGGAVAWHTLQKKYYAAFAGNRTYPLAVFNTAGKLLSDEDSTTMVDLRGLWYNPTTKKICGNGHNDIGWFSYILGPNGIPTESNIEAAGMNQPGEQCIGVYDASSKQVCFLYGQEIYVYDEDFMQDTEGTIRLYPGISRKEDIGEDDYGDEIGDDYNNNVLLYPGIPKAEFGILNAVKGQVELYNRKTGLLTQILKLPYVVKTWRAFNFSYANDTYWAFDQDTRTWTGYK